MLELAALCALIAAVAAGPSVAAYSSTVIGPSSSSTVSREDGVHATPLLQPYLSYERIPLAYSSPFGPLAPYSPAQYAPHLIKKRSIVFAPPGSYISATPYAPTFYAPATIGTYSTTSLLPRGPFVSAYTAPAHYIKKRSVMTPAAFIAPFYRTSLDTTPHITYRHTTSLSQSHFIKKRDLEQL
ncbi:unnamed protein product, partial [Iphiclides podalirius]